MKWTRANANRSAASRAARAVDPAELARDLCDARERTLALVAGLSEDEMRVPLLATVNPPLWELGHVAWFQEKWMLRRAAGTPALRADADALFDSAAVHHDARWTIALPARAEIAAYLAHGLTRALALLEREPVGRLDAYFARLATFHEDMHGEAFVYTRQTLGWPAPVADRAPEAGALTGDVEVPGGTFFLGACEDEEFVFDNEKWAHPVELAPFRIARAPVTQAEFAEFVDAGGYERDELWSADGVRWRDAARARGPLYWRRDGSGWMRKHFDAWVRLEEHRPVVHVNAHEAEAWCRWRGRRLPSEAEWEATAVGVEEHGRLAREKRRFPWGDDPPTSEHAHLDLVASGCADVGACPAGDSAFGCRQMLGNVWEWTASTFGPYPGFVVDPYREYSEPWFTTHRVLRGGAFATRARLLRGTWRNFFTPDRRDVLAGFRTAAL